MEFWRICLCICFGRPNASIAVTHIDPEFFFSLSLFFFPVLFSSFFSSLLFSLLFFSLFLFLFSLSFPFLFPFFFFFFFYPPGYPVVYNDGIFTKEDTPLLQPAITTTATTTTALATFSLITYRPQQHIPLVLQSCSYLT